ncbi:MAG: hypothetical protein H0U49_11145 [Parachlamydiaceae bacterium]|nr:hypothetical protein [Parachlamydiaceae bacterium]
MQPLGSTITRLNAEEERVRLASNSYPPKRPVSTKDSELKKRINEYALHYVFFCCVSIASAVAFASTLAAFGTGFLSLNPLVGVAILVITAASALVCADRAVHSQLLKFHAEEKIEYGC